LIDSNPSYAHREATYELRTNKWVCLTEGRGMVASGRRLS
jgi:hypothetical protein